MKIILAKTEKDLQSSDEKAELAFVGKDAFQPSEDGWESMTKQEEKFDFVEEQDPQDEEKTVKVLRRVQRRELRFVPARTFIDLGFVSREKFGTPTALNYTMQWSESELGYVKVFDHDVNGDEVVLVGY